MYEAQTKADEEHELASDKLQAKAEMQVHSYGLCNYGLYSYGLCSYGLYSYGLYSYGPYSYGLYSYGQRQAAGQGRDAGACIGMAYIGLYSYDLNSDGLFSYCPGASRDVRRRRPRRRAAERQRLGHG